MIGFIIISILVIIIIFGTKQDKIISNNYEKKHDGFLENFSTAANKNNDNSIIDVTGQSFTINSNLVLNKYIPGVPYWPHQYVYSYSEINSTSTLQKEFYRIFKYSFLNGVHYELEGNTNYAFILLFDLLNEYDNHKNISTLENQIKILGGLYPKTKSYGNSFLVKKQEVNNNIYLGSHIYRDSWELGEKYKTKLGLDAIEVELINKLAIPNDSFCNIEFCLLEVCKLYLAVFSNLINDLIKNNKSLEEELLIMADIIARKDFRYRKGSQNYNYCVKKITTDEFYTHVFKKCDKAIREYYDINNKRNIETYFINTIYDSQFYTNVISKIDDSIDTLITRVKKPSKVIEIELNLLFTTRWRIKYGELIKSFDDDNSSQFVDSIIELSKLNIKNPSIENIFFEASKFMAKFNNESALCLYIHYLYHDLKSVTFNNKKLNKSIQKSLFKTNEQLEDFEKIVKQLIKEKDLEKALKAIPKIYEVKRKKIQLDKTLINEAIEQHSDTVKLLNEYLKDDFEEDNNVIVDIELEKSIKLASKEVDEFNAQPAFRWRDKFDKSKADFEEYNNSIKSQEISKDEVQQSAFVDEIIFTEIHTTTLELFIKNNFSISQIDFETFAKSKGVFKNQLIESINETCYDFLDDLLIEEEEDYYTIDTNYFQKISTK